MRKPTTVLVIDDDPAIARVLEFAIDYLDGWTARFATDEATARAALAESVPDYILLDKNLANSDGIDVLASLRAVYDLSGSRVVLMTAAGPTHSADELRQLGIAQALTKPFDPTSLPSLLNS